MVRLILKSTHRFVMLRARLVLQILLLLLITFEKPELSIQNYAGINVLELTQYFKVAPQIPALSVPVLADLELLLHSNSMADLKTFDERDNNQVQIQYLEVIQRRWQMTKFRVKTMYEELILYNLEHLLDDFF